MCEQAFCCSDCQYVHCNKDWVEACTDCTHAVATNFRRKCQEYKKENEELCQGMEDLYKKYMNIDEDEK